MTVANVLKRIGGIFIGLVVLGCIALIILLRNQYGFALALPICAGELLGGIIIGTCVIALGEIIEQLQLANSYHAKILLQLTKAADAAPATPAAPQAHAAPPRAPSVSAGWRCKKCGTQNTSTALICKDCGADR